MEKETFWKFIEKSFPPPFSFEFKRNQKIKNSIFMTLKKLLKLYEM